MPAMGPAGIGMGAVSIVFGILVLAWPGATLLGRSEDGAATGNAQDCSRDVACVGW